MKIGVVGKFCSGKDVFASYLISKGFEHISLSDLLREEARNKGMEITRESLRNLGDELRRLNGGNFLVKKALVKLKGKDIVVTSIRNPSEAKELINNDFVIVHVDAPIEERFRRIVARGKNENDPDTLNKVKESENKEQNSKTYYNMDLDKCISLASFTLKNDSTLEDFYTRIDQTIDKIKQSAL